MPSIVRQWRQGQVRRQSSPAFVDPSSRIGLTASSLPEFCSQKSPALPMIYSFTVDDETHQHPIEKCRCTWHFSEKYLLSWTTCFEKNFDDKDKNRIFRRFSVNRSGIAWLSLLSCIRCSKSVQWPVGRTLDCWSDANLPITCRQWQFLRPAKNKINLLKKESKIR